MLLHVCSIADFMHENDISLVRGLYVLVKCSGNVEDVHRVKISKLVIGM